MEKKVPREKSLCSKILSLMLAAVMMVSVIGIMPENVSAADKSLPAKGGTAVITDEDLVATSGAVQWIQYKPKADGYLKIVFKENSKLVSYPDGYVQLYNNTKTKALSKTTDFWTEENAATFKSDYYGVKKGTVYYIGVLTNGGVSINAKFTKVKDGSKKQSKAVNMKRKKKVTGIIKAEDSKARWYKFKISKPAQLKLSIKPCLTDDVRITLKGPGKGNSASGTIQCKSYNAVTGRVYANSFAKNTVFYNPKGRYHKTGTYYIKIEPTTKKCTGYYELKWQ